MSETKKMAEAPAALDRDMQAIVNMLGDHERRLQLLEKGEKPPVDPPPENVTQEDIDWEVLREKGCNWVVGATARGNYDQPSAYLLDRLRETVRKYKGEASGVIFKLPLLAAAQSHGGWKESTLAALRGAVEEMRKIQPDLRFGVFVMLQTFNHPSNSDPANFLPAFVWTGKRYGIGTHGDRQPYGCSKHRENKNKWYTHKGDAEIIDCYRGILLHLIEEEDWCEIVVTSESAMDSKTMSIPGYSPQKMIELNTDMHISLVPALRKHRKFLLSNWNFVTAASDQTEAISEVHKRLAPTRFVTVPTWPDLMLEAEGAGGGGEIGVNQNHEEAMRRHNTVVFPAIQGPTWTGNRRLLPQLLDHAKALNIAGFWGTVGWTAEGDNNAHEIEWADLVKSRPLAPVRPE